MRTERNVPEPVNDALNEDADLAEADPQRWDSDGMRNEKGQYIEGSKGNPGGMGSTAGVVAYVKSLTNDCFEMIDLFVSVMRGEKLANSDWVGGPKERMQAASELLDRAIGKPKQTIEDTRDDNSGEVLATMQALLKVKNVDATTNSPLAPGEENISSIESMKRKQG